MAQNDFSRPAWDEGGLAPIERFTTWRLARKETVLKQEIESYYVSDVDNSSIIRLGRRSLGIAQTLELPDCVCEGLTFKQRLVQTERGECLLLARWKPDRHMRRNAPDWSQKWFVEKQLFPPDKEKLFSRLVKRFQDQAMEAATPALVPAAAAEGEEEYLAPPEPAAPTEGAETAEATDSEGEAESE